MTKAPTPEDRYLAKQARMVAFMIAGTMILWVGAQWLGGRLGWDSRFAFLFDLAALAAFVWALVVTYRLWRRQKAGPRNN
ncbi:DUF5337 domain-containing protein [Paracoccaceae bacterium Fryx2]|nr:DUF5337 domain-containing protein [Paracoccaceae bacterium Fryx2]